MPDPFQARELLIEYGFTLAMDNRLETPMVVRGALVASTCDVNCLAVHDAKSLNVLTLERPTVYAPFPDAHHNAFSRMMCIAQCYALLYDPAGPNFLKPFWEKWGLDGIQGVRQDVYAAVVAAKNGDSSSLGELLQGEDYHPFLMGQIVFLELAQKFQTDGWNQNGALVYDEESGQPVPCTANCEAYSDLIGYYPKNNPSSSTGKARKKKREKEEHNPFDNVASKYKVEGNDMYWQPLYEDDGYGYFSHQMHVAPHIGYTVKPLLFDFVKDIGTVPDPKYDYRSEALQVVDRLRETASDAVKKEKIAVYDDKLLVRGMIEKEMRLQFKSVYSFEDELLFIHGIDAGEYDGLLVTWREKVDHDLVRPTTVIRKWGGDMLDTFSGDKSKDGPMKIAARDFQAFQRVMPHSEYPSASACLCTTYAQFADAFSKYYSDGFLADIKWAGDDGFKVGCVDGQEPFPFVSRGCDDVGFVIKDMETLGKECGDSRLWAGLHFTQAVSAGEELCDGLGTMALEYEKKIRNESTFGSKYYQDDARPICNARRNLRKED
mmetsp:Transcript_3099/g.6823  ORF Transcript_3099/g.6823 Transcript_3099/m.6823 type:complete len:548 (+) Transcript_3099:302-1945(+)